MAKSTAAKVRRRSAGERKRLPKRRPLARRDHLDRGGRHPASSRIVSGRDFRPRRAPTSTISAASSDSAPSSLPVGR